MQLALRLRVIRAIILGNPVGTDPSSLLPILHIIKSGCIRRSRKIDNIAKFYGNLTGFLGFFPVVFFSGCRNGAYNAPANLFEAVARCNKISKEYAYSHKNEVEDNSRSASKSILLYSIGYRRGGVS